MLQARQEIIWSCIKESEKKWTYSGGEGLMEKQWDFHINWM